MANDIFLIGEIGFDVTLDSVIAQVKETNQKKPLDVHIHSMGGGVFDGLAIYNYFKGLPQGVNTHSSGLVASIASIIFLAGKERSINSTDNFLIHLPSGGSFGNAEDLEKTAETLRDIEDKIATIYENETNITKKEALKLMEKDEFLDVEFLKEKGFVNEIIEFKAVAKFDNKDNMSEQLSKKEVDNMFVAFYDKHIKGLLSSKDKAIDNKVVQDANGVDIEFTNLSESDAPKKGDAAVIDGKKASGDITMPNGEVWKFENGLLNEIVEVNQESELEKVTALLEDQNALVATKETEIVDIQAKLDAKDVQFTEMETAFTELKNTVTSKFEHKDKTDQPKDKVENKSRQLFKE